jgi:hypothetical protein
LVSERAQVLAEQGPQQLNRLLTREGRRSFKEAELVRRLLRG